MRGDNQGVTPASNMCFGVVVVDEFEKYNDQSLMPLVSQLEGCGCQSHNILVRRVPRLHDVLMATQFFAEYTDVDGVILLVPENRLTASFALMYGIVNIQTQWNMVVEYGDETCAKDIVKMIELQNDMERSAPESCLQRLNCC